MIRADVFRAAIAGIVLVALFVVALAAVNRRPLPPPEITVVPGPPPQDLSAELRRCDALGPQQVDDRNEETHCRSVWEENRRHFFGQRKQSDTPPAVHTPNAGTGVRP